MAKQSSVNLDITNNVDGFDISGGTTPRTLSVTGGSVTLAGSGSATVTFPTTSTTIAGLGISQTFTALQSFSAGISAAGGVTLAGTLQGTTANFTGLVSSAGGFSGEGTNLTNVAKLNTSNAFSAGSILTLNGVGMFASQAQLKSNSIVFIEGYDGGSTTLLGSPYTSLANTVTLPPTTGTVALTNTTVASINGFTGAVQVTGSGAVVHSVSGTTTTLGARLASASVTGVASFGNEFVVTSGAVGLTSNYVKSINGATGAVTNVAKTNVDNNFSSAQTIDGPGAYLEIIGSLGDAFTLTPGVGIVVSDAYNSPQTLQFSQTGTTTTVTLPSYTTTLAGLSVNQTFTALNSFNAGLSASGATFANDIKVNGVNIGLGAGNVASNLGIGKGALSGNSGGLFNTAIGSGAMEIGTNSYSVAFGYNALNSCTGGGINNVALGSSTMTTIGSASSNVAIGANSSHSLKDGNYNISIGVDALSTNNNGSSNIAIGHQALYTNGYDLNASNNIAIGYQALYTNDDGQQNTAIGNEALRSIATTGSAERNTAIGYQAGRWKGATGTGVVVNRLNTANDSIFIGWRARSSADAQTNQIVIGNDTVGGGSNTTTIGTTASTDATIYGKLHGTNGVSGPTASFNSLTVSQNSTLGSTASNTTTIYGVKIVNESLYSNGTLRTVGINFANGQVQTLTGIGTGATGATAIYFTGAPATGAGNVTLLVTNGGSMTGNTTTWGGNIKWPGGVKPTLTTTGIDVVSFVTPDAGTTIYGFLGGLNFS
jgi:hypothetical protein